MDRLPMGFVNIHKPEGPTSTAVGSIVRRELRELLPFLDRKRLGVGHFGTLDPAATGVLPLAVGNATRLLPYITEADKQYAFTLVLGLQTHTGDSSGTEIGRAEVPPDWAQRLPAVLAEFVGAGLQIPPMVSALRVDGRRLHEIARAGETVERTPRPIIVHAIDLLSLDVEKNAARIRTTCSAGTYIRSLCEDIAVRLQTVGHMHELVRERAGPFSLDTAVTLADVREQGLAALIDPRTIMPLAEMRLDETGTRDFHFGRSIHVHERAAIVRGAVEEGAAVFISGTAGNSGGAGELLGIAEVSGVILRPKVVFA